MGPSRKIVIYGGAFDPPHLGHASCIEAALRLFPCEEIWIMPSSDRADKTIKASGDHRLEMLKMMVADLFPEAPVKISFSTLELKRPKLTTTYETLLELKKLYNSLAKWKKPNPAGRGGSLHPNFEFWFLMGSELLNDIWSKWVNGPELYREANFLAVRNPFVALPKILPKNLNILKDTPRLDISSTFLRKILKRGYSGIPYLSPAVAFYISKHRLYT